MGGESRGVVRSSQPYQLWTGERRGARARTATIRPLPARMHVFTGDGPKGRKGWHRSENNLSAPLRARGSVVAFSVWVGPSFSWRETSRWDRRCQFFEGRRNSGHQLVRGPSAAWPWNFESQIADGSVLLEHSWVVCEAKSHVVLCPVLVLQTRRRKGTKCCGAEWQEMISRLKSEARCFCTHTQQSALLSNIFFVTRAYTFFLDVKPSCARVIHPLRLDVSCQLDLLKSHDSVDAIVGQKFGRQWHRIECRLSHVVTFNFSILEK